MKSNRFLVEADLGEEGMLSDVVKRAQRAVLCALGQGEFSFFILCSGTLELRCSQHFVILSSGKFSN